MASLVQVWGLISPGDACDFFVCLHLVSVVIFFLKPPKKLAAPESLLQKKRTLSPHPYPLHMPLCVVCARHLYSNQHISIHGPQSPEQQAVDCRVEAPVEALGVLSLSSCSAHAERVACVVCTRGAHSRRSRGAHAALTRRSLGPARVGDGDVRAGLGRPGVEEDGDDDERGAAPEAVVRGEVEEGHGGEARQKDRECLVRGGA